MSLYRWMYRGGRPNGVAKFLNGISAFIHSRGVAPSYLVTLEVLGRSSGKPVSFPLVMTVIDGERYLVSMLGEANWVRNAKADGNRATLHHGATERVLLEEVPVEQRAPIIKAFLAHAPGARPHIPVEKDAPLAAFEEIAPKYPVFRVLPAE
ncbi:nitroreductase family deazaflavin-dependent oxidoreductase [Chloroflexia bacterium SDU3-3]|nr:nitroreductase family deazaflavin-dependent oxidoreductase [Chloroflexia bacterium SDU3-3]